MDATRVSQGISASLRCNCVELHQYTFVQPFVRLYMSSQHLRDSPCNPQPLCGALDAVDAATIFYVGSQRTPSCCQPMIVCFCVMCSEDASKTRKIGNNPCSTFSFTKCAAIKVWAKPNLRLPPAITPEGHSLKFIPKMSCAITNMFPEYTVDIAYRQTRRWSTKQSKAASKNFWQSR